MKITIPIQPEVKEGDILKISKFAFFPIWFYSKTEKTLLWLQPYIQVYEAQKVLEPVADAIGPYGCWLAWHNEWHIKWIKKEKILWDSDAH